MSANASARRARLACSDRVREPAARASSSPTRPTAAVAQRPDRRRRGPVGQQQAQRRSRRRRCIADAGRRPAAAALAGHRRAGVLGAGDPRRSRELGRRPRRMRRGQRRAGSCRAREVSARRSSASCVHRRASPACGQRSSSSVAACRRRPSNSAHRQIGGVGQSQQPGAQRQQVAGEVAAVDRRDVARRQRLERPRVVPVVEVAAVALQPVQRARASRAVRSMQLAGARCSRSRRPPGWRAATGRCWSATCGARAPARVLLEVVGRQPVVLGVDEASRRSARSCARRGRRNARLVGDRAAARARRSGRLSHQAISGRGQPQQPGAAARRRAHRLASHGQRRAAAAAGATAGAIHIDRVASAETAVPRAALARRLAVCHSSRLRRVTSSRHSVRTIASRLTIASCGRQASANRGLRASCRAGRARDAARCWRSAASAGLRSSAGDAVESVGQARGPPRRRSVHEPRPRQRASSRAASSSTQRGRHQAAAQVVEDLPARQARTAGCRIAAPVGRRHARQQPAAAICQSPRIQRCRRLDVGARSAPGSPRTAARRSAGRRGRSSPRAGRG